ncbi:hypothetical protein [Limosilactobacillus frumenti]|uniref:hypothetical protein n=1 Tax=Limosilactobacillus frumenti TaxID=104955 RepID=UPI0015ECB99C|nr:hypothetical protein [Limosilactobacillus frumenti]MBA2913872.1 hypothetical protein [Limosilactobacillus frumenti]
MDSNLVKLINDSQQIIQNCQKQLNELKKDPNSDSELIKSLQDTYQQANETLVAAQEASSKQVTRPTNNGHVKKEEQPRRMTRAEYRHLHEKGEI